MNEEAEIAERLETQDEKEALEYALNLAYPSKPKRKGKRK
jgi:hypothetical protein